MESEKERERGGKGGRWEPPEAGGGRLRLSEGFRAPYCPIGLSREQKREREHSEGGRGTNQTDGASVARLPMAGEPTPTA